MILSFCSITVWYCFLIFAKWNKDTIKTTNTKITNTLLPPIIHRFNENIYKEYVNVNLARLVRNSCSVNAPDNGSVVRTRWSALQPDAFWRAGGEPHPSLRFDGCFTCPADPPRVAGFRSDQLSKWFWTYHIKAPVCGLLFQRILKYIAYLVIIHLFLIKTIGVCTL